MKKLILPILFPIALLFGTGHNTTIDVLILVATWGYLLLVLLAGLFAIMGVFTIGKVSTLLDSADAVAEYLQDDGSDKEITEIVDKFKPMAKKPKLYRVIPLMILWLGSLAYIEWTATAVFYLIVTTFGWLSVYMLTATLQGVTEKIGGVAQGAVDAPTTVKKKLKSLSE